jgi:hypothetical protein
MNDNLTTNASNEAESPAFLVGAVMPSCLRLSLKTKWFEMTKAGIKTEDYREINDYWVKRLFHHKESKLTTEEIVRYINYYKYYGYVDVSAIFTYHDLSFKEFQQNVMTLGYPKSNDTERILKLEHKGIEIRTGNPEWGAEPNKLYFVIIHGAVLA